MNTFKLAVRGLTRNSRRSLVTLLTIAFGFAAISLFAGYTHNVYEGLARQAIHGGLLGHLTLHKRGMDTEGKLDPERYLLTGPEVEKARRILVDEPHIQLVAPRLGLSGLLSNGKSSTIFIADGIEPRAMEVIQAGLLSLSNIRPEVLAAYLKKLNPQRPEEVELASGLAELLHLPRNAQAAMLVSTVSGQANALDVSVGGTFDTGNAGTNDKLALMTLQLAQTLYDVDGGADRLTLLLDDVALTDDYAVRLAEKLKAAGLPLEIRTWKDLSDFYKQVHTMFNMIFGFIFSIVLTVVVMSVANSMGMTVIERTREIGTLRAIGLRRSGVVRLFATESLLLSLTGCLLGLLITVAVRAGVNLADISYVPPSSTSPVPLLVDLDLPRIAFTFVLMLLVGGLAAWLPARRAAVRPVMDALGHN